MLEPPLLGAGNRVYPFLICSHRSADSTVHLWDVLPTSEDGTDAMEAKPGAVLSHSVPADGENIITSIAWNVRMSFFHSLERRNIAGDRLLRRRSEVLERGILVRPHRVSPEIPGFQRLLLPLRHASSRHRLASLLLRLPHRLGRRVAGRRVFFRRFPGIRHAGDQRRGKAAGLGNQSAVEL